MKKEISQIKKNVIMKRELIYDAMTTEFLTGNDIAKMIGENETDVKKELGKMYKEGVLKRELNKATKSMQYALTDEGLRKKDAAKVARLVAEGKGEKPKAKHTKEQKAAKAAADKQAKENKKAEEKHAKELAARKALEAKVEKQIKSGKIAPDKKYVKKDGGVSIAKMTKIRRGDLFNITTREGKAVCKVANLEWDYTEGVLYAKVLTNKGKQLWRAVGKLKDKAVSKAFDSGELKSRFDNIKETTDREWEKLFNKTVYNLK